MAHMDNDPIQGYSSIREGNSAFYQQKRGLIAVWGSEAVQFLDGLITNNVKELADGDQMPAAFPNAQGRLLALVRVRRGGDRFLIETEESTTEKVYQNLFRFTFAGDFFVENLSEQYRYFEIFGLPVMGSEPEPLRTVEFDVPPWPQSLFVPIHSGEAFAADLGNTVSDDLYETFRIERGVPKYGVDMDETTIVPEVGLGGLISYNKGCYIGQEIIARIHFRGHVAKRLTGLRSEPGAVATGLLPGAELSTPDGKNAGRITSVTFSKKLETTIALGYVRYGYLTPGTELTVDGVGTTVADLPFVH
ncbi:MAG: glycine cleavage T C-terminal barrel domain-containing protein [Pyrinomonadaceae bacterium]